MVATVSGLASADPVVGQSIIYRYDSTHSYVGFLSGAVGDGSYGVVVLDPDDYLTSWTLGPSSQASFATLALYGVWEDDTGTTNNRWRPNPGVPVQGPQGDTGATGATGATGPGALVTSTSAPSLTLGGSAVQFDATHDVEYTAVVKISASLSLTGGQAGHVDLVCDSSSSPSTVVETAQLENTGALTVGLSIVSSMTQSLRWRAPAGHYCKLTTTNDTGTPTFTLVRQWKQVLGN